MQSSAFTYLERRHMRSRLDHERIDLDYAIINALEPQMVYHRAGPVPHRIQQCWHRLVDAAGGFIPCPSNSKVMGTTWSSFS